MDDESQTQNDESSEMRVYKASELPKFSISQAQFIPTVFGGHVLVYESRSHPGHRREFAFKTRFTNQAGVSSCYYRCMSCRSAKSKMKPGPDQKLPQIPCIAVKNGFIVNDPDFPEANDHFCIPPTIEESKKREANGFGKAVLNGRSRQRATRKSSLPISTSANATRTANPNMFMAGVANSTNISFNKALLNQLTAYQSLTNSLFDQNILDMSFLNNQLCAASSSSTSTTEPGVGNSITNFSESTSPLERLQNNRIHGIKIEDLDPADVTTSANNLLASLISSEPALHTDVTFPRSHASSISTSVASLFEGSDTYVSALNSLNQANTTNYGSLGCANNSSALGAGSNGSIFASLNAHNTSNNGNFSERNQRKRKIPLSDHYDQIRDHYITNSWDLPENYGNVKNIAELVCAFILSLAKQVPQAASSLKAGKWMPRNFFSDEIEGKTLAFIGLGSIAFEVAQRMSSFGMKLIGYDPLVSIELAGKNGVTWIQLNKIWAQADFISLHVPNTPKTDNLICSRTLSMCKRGVKIINIARGRIVNEADILRLLNTGHVGGAAFDAFEEEPAQCKELIEHPNVICTPGLISNFVDRSVRSVADDIAAMNGRLGVFGGVCGSGTESALAEAKSQWIKTASVLAQIIAEVANHPKSVLIQIPINARGMDKALVASVTVGLLASSGNVGSNLVNAEINALQEGISVEVESSDENNIVVATEDKSVSGYPSPAGTIISSLNDSKVPVPLIAMGTMGISFEEKSSSNILSEALREKMVMECKLMGSGCIVIFNSLESNEIKQVSKHFTVIRL